MNALLLAALLLPTRLLPEVLTAGALRQAELQRVLREFQFQDAQVTALLAEAACDW